jgi:hypothetical protein
MYFSIFYEAKYHVFDIEGAVLPDKQFVINNAAHISHFSKSSTFLLIEGFFHRG